jgi:AcrR family transcriptional regulator
MHEKPFEEITVQHILDRAGVSRSTFYTHFSDKNDLFLSDAEEFFELAAFALVRKPDGSQRLAPVRELFAHVAEWRAFYEATAESGKQQDMLELCQGCFARGIAERLKQIAASPEREARNACAAAPPTKASTAVSQMLAGALVSLMSWWMHAGQSFSASQMDDLYHEFAWAGVASASPANKK